LVTAIFSVLPNLHPPANFLIENFSLAYHLTDME